MQPRSPVVAILGHVDHGKTTLLDFIRKSSITQKEHGSITQRIGAYEISTGIKGYPTDKITFIDTPGHEAFAKLRARGATVADIALLLIDAKDGIKPQTIESISHIKSSGIPFIVVLNKIDLPEANAEKIKAGLMKQEVVVEDKGGKTPVVLISAKSGKGVPELLESILLLTSELNLQADSQHAPQAPIIEINKDKRGVVISAIIKDGKLKVGDVVYAEDQKAKIRSLFNDLGKPIREVFPSMPFELLGFADFPPVGAVMSAQATQVTPKSNALPAQKSPLDPETFLQDTEQKKFSVIIKADTQGSLDAITDSVGSYQGLEIILAGVGEIYKSDIFLAKTVGAIIIGFNTRVDAEAAETAKQEKVVIKTYNIIYELLEELTEVTSLLKEKEEQEKTVKGEGRILATFIIHDEKVLGVKITKGKANLGDPVEIFREGNLMGKSKIVSLRIRAKKVDEVKKDQEAGILLSPQLDIKTGDMIKLVL